MSLWTSIQWMETLIIATLGGLLGTMFTIALRRLFIVEEALPIPKASHAEKSWLLERRGAKVPWQSSMHWLLVGFMD